MKLDSYADLLEALKPALGGEITMYHVQFSAPTVAFEKPVTEILILTLKAPENRPSVVDILSKISEASEKMLVFGQTVEDENKYILVGGWPTVEVCNRATLRPPLVSNVLIHLGKAHWETVAKPDVAAALSTLYSLASKDHIFHTKLSQYRL